MDDTFGGVNIGPVEPQVIVAITNRPGPSGYSGYSGSGGGGGGSGAGESGFSGYSGRSGPGGASGFSGFSSRSGYSGYSGVGTSGFSGYSGASGQSGQAGGQSGYSGYSGLDGTFSASGFSGYSGFSSRSGFSGYSGFSGSGISGYSGFSGQTISGFSGFSGPGTSGFSGFSSSGFSGFSGKSGYSGYSGFSGAGAPSTGTSGTFQYADGAGNFLSQDSLTSDGVGNTFATATRFFFQDPSDTTKTVRFDASPLLSGSNVAVRVSANSVTVLVSGAAANQFVTGIDSSGNLLRAQPTTANLSGLITYGQLDRSTSVVAETATLTIAANTKVKSTASGTLTTIAFSGGNNAQQGRRLDLDITGGPYTLTIPACRRIGETATISSLQVFAGYNEFSWEFINGEYVLSDSVSEGGAGGSGESGFSGYSGAGTTGTSGFSGRSGYSAYSGFSGAGTAGSSGFSGFSGSGGGSSSLLFTNHNDIDWTLVIGDANSGIKMISAVAHTVTVPTNASVPFTVGTQIVVEQGGTAAVAIAAAGGVTLQGASSTSGQYSTVVLIKQGTDQWLSARSGTSGYSGFSGSAGASGFSGFSGSSGGGSGFSGFSGGGGSGFSGFSGRSGYSGYSAFSGYSGPTLLTFSTKTDIDYTLVLGDANTGIKMASSSAHSLTVPPNSSVAFPTGTQIPVEQGGTASVAIVAGAGVTLQGASSTAGQFSVVCLIKQGTDTWLVSSGNSGYSGYSGSSGYSGYSGRSGYSAFSGFSGSGGWTKLTVASDAATSSLTLVDIPDLVTPTLSGSTLYAIHAVLYCSVSATASMQVGISATGSGSAATLAASVTGTSTTTNGTTVTLVTSGASTQNFLTSPSITGIIEITGFCTTASAGSPTIAIQQLKVTGGTSTVKIGSYLEYRPA